MYRFKSYWTGWWCNNHLEKYEFVNGKDDIPYMKWKIQLMFETTNQWLVDDLHFSDASTHPQETNSRQTCVA